MIFYIKKIKIQKIILLVLTGDLPWNPSEELSKNPEVPGKIRQEVGGPLSPY